MPPSAEKLGFHGPFLERGGINAPEMVETLVDAPELPLSDEELREAYAFENQLFTHEIADGKTIESIIRAHKAEATVAPLFFAQAFIEGKVTSNEVDPLPRFVSEKEVYAWLAVSVSNKTILPKTLRALAKQSAGLYKEKVASALVEGTDLEPAWQTMQPTLVEPEAFVENANDVRRIREYLLHLRQDYQEGDDRLEGAKRAIVDVYLSRVNSMVASDIPVADYLYNQANLINDEEMAEVALHTIPASFQNAIIDADQRASTFRRLDFLRNGMGLDVNGKASAVAHAVELVAGAGETAHDTPRFTPEQTRILKETMVEPSEIRVMMSAILASAGMLSGEPPETWTPKRKHRAADELFQVVENPAEASFAVDGVSGAYKTPSAPRSLYDVLVVGGFHELTHINQAEADKVLGQNIQLASLKGKRLSMLRESGADIQQRAAEQAYFGTSKPVSLTYARALQALEAGGNVMDATKASYAEHRRILPEVPPQKAADNAADRVLRLVRQGGISSAAMSYAEGGLFVAGLGHASPEVRRRAGAITSFDIVDQIRLHKYGLLPGNSDGDIDWTPHIKRVLAPYIAHATNN